MTGEQQRPLVARTEQTVSSHLGRALAEVSSSAVVDRTSAVCICEKTILDLPRNWLGVDRPTRALIVCPALTRRRRWCVSQLAAGKATKSPKTRWRHAKADAGHFSGVSTETAISRQRNGHRCACRAVLFYIAKAARHQLSRRGETGQLTLLVFQVLGSSIASLEEIEATRFLNETQEAFSGEKLHKRRQLL